MITLILLGMLYSSIGGVTWAAMEPKDGKERDGFDVVFAMLWPVTAPALLGTYIGRRFQRRLPERVQRELEAKAHELEKQMQLKLEQRTDTLLEIAREMDE